MVSRSQSLSSQNTQIKPDATATELHVRRGIVNGLRSKIRRLRASLRQAYLQSKLRRMVLETRSFPLRILAIVRSSSLRYGPTILGADWDEGIGDVYLENRYGRACMSRIQELQKNHQWMTAIDQEICARMYRWGALWYRDNLASSSCTETHSTEQIQPSETPRARTIV